MPEISVIIPTYNRPGFLRDILASLADQTLRPERFEVIIVDDGSTDDTGRVQQERFPFCLRYFRQENQGDAEARNHGARQSAAEILVFLDDDIVVAPGYLRCLYQAQIGHSNRIVVGTERLWLEEAPPTREARMQADPAECGRLAELPFVEVCSNNMSIPRERYLQVGMMQGLDFPGSSIWCDVEFAYRAHQQEMVSLRAPGAICWHRDYVSLNLSNRKERMWKTAYRAASLFRRHPELERHLPMFADKSPVRWDEDSPRMVARKLARRLSSTPPILRLMQTTSDWLQAVSPNWALLDPLQRWIVGGQIYLGYRAGLRDLSHEDEHPALD